MRTIRPERSFEHYSRGPELLADLRAMWEKNRKLPAGANDEIAQNVEAVRKKHDLTYDELYFWSDVCSGREST